MLHRILVADDSDTARRALAAWLEGTGCDVALAADGSEALHLLLDHAFDLSFLDVHMPELTGIQVLDHLLRSGRPVPSILMTGHPSRELETEALEVGALAMLHKPIQAGILEVVLAQALGLQRGDPPLS